MRCWSRSKLGRPSASNATISPSSTALCELSARLSGLTSGYCALMSFRLRLSSRSRPGSEYAIARTPSHLISYAQPSSFAGSVPSLAIIGTTCSGIGSRPGSAGGSIRWISQSFSLLPAWKSA